MLRKLEILLWVVAVVALGTYAWVYLDREIYQAYSDWSFDRALDHQPAPVYAFVWHVLRSGGIERQSQESTVQMHVPAPAPQAAAPAGRQRRPVELPKEGVVGRLEIPRVGLRAMILEGTSDRALRRAVGHIEGTPLPGENGNTGLAGHRDTFFNGLKHVKRNDRVRVKTLEGTFEYVVESIRIVGPEDVEVLSPTQAPALTLVTCYPFNYVGQAPKRYIVRAVAEPTRAAALTGAGAAPIAR